MELPAWLEAIPPALQVATVSIIPAFELSGSIPYGILVLDLPVWEVVTVALLANWLVVPIVFLFFGAGLKLFLRFRWFQRFWQWYTDRVLRKLEKGMQSWGIWALFIFVAIPGPGSGLYTASVGAFLLGVPLKRYVWVVLLGQLVAAAWVTAIVLTGARSMQWFLNLH
jgi:uncharacterized membrane protein